MIHIVENENFFHHLLALGGKEVRSVRPERFVYLTPGGEASEAHASYEKTGELPRMKLARHLKSAVWGEVEVEWEYSSTIQGGEGWRVGEYQWAGRGGSWQSLMFWSRASITSKSQGVELALPLITDVFSSFAFLVEETKRAYCSNRVAFDPVQWLPLRTPPNSNDQLNKPGLHPFVGRNSITWDYQIDGLGLDPSSGLVDFGRRPF